VARYIGSTIGRYVDATGWLGLQVRLGLEAGDATKEWRPTASKDVAAYLGALAPRLWERPPDKVINVENGLLDIATDELGSRSGGRSSNP